MSEVIAIIPAAGCGSRMKAAVPKQYIKFGRSTMLELTAGKLARVLGAENVYIGVSPEDAYAADLDLKSMHVLRTGGATRAQTVANTLRAAIEAGAAGKDDLVLVHDAARPLVEESDICRLIEAAKEHIARGTASGCVLAIAVADAVFMLQYSTYSVISPEGCASILWKNAGKAPEAAQALGLTAETLKKLGLIDKVISEPIGGAHSDPRLMASTLRKALVDQLKIVQSLTIDELLERRISRLLSYGRFEAQGPHAAARIASLFGDDDDKLENAAGEINEKQAPAQDEAPKAPAKRRRTTKKSASAASKAQKTQEDVPAQASEPAPESAVEAASEAAAADAPAKSARRRKTTKTAKAAASAADEALAESTSEAKPARRRTSRKSAPKAASAEGKTASEPSEESASAKSQSEQGSAQAAQPASEQAQA